MSRFFLFATKKSSLFQLKTSLDVFMASNKDEKLYDSHVKGNYIDQSYMIYQGTQIIAEVNNKNWS